MHTPLARKSTLVRHAALTTLLLAAIPSCAPWLVTAQTLDDSTGLGIATLHDFKALRQSSNNPDPNSNDDSKRPIPGETVVLADLQGPGVVTHIWITVAAREYAWPRLLRLRIYYDGSSTASVDAPLGDFFAVGHGMERPVNSIMVQDSSDGRSRNCYWPMPFRRSVKITITNEGRQRVANLYYHVDWRKVASLPPNVGYFHALYRQATPVRKGDHYEFLSVKGRGQYVGTVLSVVQTEPGWFGEGDDQFYVDGEKQPSIVGTGTEDYFNNAWGLRISEGPYVGAPVAEDGTNTGARITAYRWHLRDPIPFQKSLRFEIEAAGWTFNPDGSVRSAFEPRADLFSSVAFWYQQGIAQGLPEPPYGAARLPHGNARQIEVEQAIDGVKTEGGKAGVMKDAFWSRDLLTFDASGPGSKISVPIDVPEDGGYELLAEIAHAPDYGRYITYLDGRPLAPQNLEHEPGAKIVDSAAMNLWNTELYVAEDHLLGWERLRRGRHTITFVCLGKDARSTGYGLGIDYIVLSRLDGGWKAESPKAAELRRLGERGRGAAASLATAVDGLGDADPDVRESAAWALTQMDEAAAGAVPALEQALTDDDAIVRGLAALSLRNIGAPAHAALPALIAALRDPDENVRMAAADAIARQGKGALPALSALIAVAQGNSASPAAAQPNSAPAAPPRPESRPARKGGDLPPAEDVQVLRSVAAALGAIGSQAATALPVLEKLRDMPRVRWAADAAIRNIRERR